MPDIQRYETARHVAEAAAGHAVAALRTAIKQYGSAVWVMAGGSSPVEAYEVVIADHQDALDWSKVTMLIGDERLVPYNSPDSNWGQIVLALTTGKLAAMKLLPPRIELGASEAAAEYEQQLWGLPLTGAGIPRLDVLWLGVGHDGHTLSLFPDHPDFIATDALVIPVRDSPKPPPTRITLTLRALTGVTNAVVFATGASKKDALARALSVGDLPIAQAAVAVEQAGGEAVWLFDQEAVI